MFQSVVLCLEYTLLVAVELPARVRLRYLKVAPEWPKRRTRKVYACYTSGAPWTGQPLKTIEDFGHTIGAQEVFGASLLN